MEELIKTNNPVTLSFVQSILNDHGIENFLLDHHMSIVDGSLGIIPRRIMVDKDNINQARRILIDNGLQKELNDSQ